MVSLSTNLGTINMNEHNEHRAVCQYIRVRYPSVLFTSDGSGVRLPIGLAAKIKTLKSDRGMPDIMVFEARGKYHGLFIEMKATGVTVFKKDGSIRSDRHLQEQWEILKKLQLRGYYAVFAVGQDEAMEIIDRYLNLDK